MDSKSLNMMNLLTSKIFHDLGNISALLGFFVSLNKEKPEKIDFNELIEINRKFLVTLAILKYAFLPGEHDENAFEYLKEYFLERKLSINFEIDEFLFWQDHLTITTHVLIVLSKTLYDGATVKILQKSENNIEFIIKSNSNVAQSDLEQFADVSKKGNIHLMLLQEMLEKNKLCCVYKFLTEKDCVLKYSPST